MNNIHNKNTTAKQQIENSADKNIGQIMKERKWGMLWNIINDYVKRKEDILKNISSRIGELSDAEKFKEIEQYLEWLSEETTVNLYIALIYKATVLNNDPQSGNYFLEKLEKVPISNYKITEYEWYMAVKSEAAGAKGVLDAVKEIAEKQDITYFEKYIEILPELFTVAEGNRKLQKKLIDQLFYKIWHIGNFNGILDIEDPLEDFADILIKFKITDTKIWDKVLKAAQVLNGDARA